MRVLPFLAAMSSSRSDVVTQYVFPCFRVCCRPSPFSVLEVATSPKEFQWCFKEVSRVFQGSFREISRVFKKSSKDVSSKFEGCFK